VCSQVFAPCSSRAPGRIRSAPKIPTIGVGDGRDSIGDVVDGPELFGELEVGQLAGRQPTLPGMAGVDVYWLPLARAGTSSG
jgi:hypothetical protein